MNRRRFVTPGAAAAAWPLAARAQQPAIPVVGLVGGGGGDISTRYVTAFRKGLNETGTIEGQARRLNITGWRVNTIACRLSWPTSSAVEWP